MDNNKYTTGDGGTVVVEDLRNYAAQIDKLAKNLQSIFNSWEELMKHYCSNTVFKGEASEAFNQKFAVLRKEFEPQIKIYQDTSKQLNDIATAHEQNDQNVSKIAEEL